ncbi:putative ABC transport system ATP-binding protein [Altererythrobacter atlanticus]|uniref:ABC transporter ATP-binding protein n=1 Tax=Croceibacterium atlanticum TaxID=1267766 RepID=UPI00062C7293|nr:ABC transporter ATP-binding protein [Croceibacterium atlanticum]MBB5731395.1 putative ABC transport system ATP-binding protein [Croceibacterium atlanticum]
MKNRRDPVLPVISLQDIRKIYTLGDNEVHALRGVSLDIEAGEFVSIVGPSGSGKSTLMHILGCLDRPTSGQYRLDDRDVSSLSGDELADIRNKRIGFVFQGFNLLPRTTAAENVEIPLLYSRPVLSAAERREKALKALEVVGLGDRAEHGSNQLSGGQQQRVAIARALVNEPSLILADEPTGNLDTRTSIDVMHALQDLRERLGITIVLITHEPEIAAYATRIIAVRDGGILSDEPNTPREALDEMPAISVAAS